MQCRTHGQDPEIAGRTPFQIAMSRLRADKLAVACFSVVHPVLPDRHLRARARRGSSGSSCGPATRRSDTDIFNFPVIGPPDHPFTWEAPLGLAPNTGDDNLAEWLYGARTSLEHRHFRHGRVDDHRHHASA